jgi:hypothetical protein
LVNFSPVRVGMKRHDAIASLRGPGCRFGVTVPPRAVQSDWTALTVIGGYQFLTAPTVVPGIV